MIYVDTSVLLADLLAEDRHPADAFWDGPLVSSRLIEYETWVRVNARGLARTHGERAQAVLGRIAFLELSPIVCGRALELFPMPVRTLDALHLASVLYLVDRRVDVTLAAYDERMLKAAGRLRIPLVDMR